MAHVWLASLIAAVVSGGWSGLEKGMQDAYVLDHKAVDAGGEEVDLAATYEGKVVLIVNTASRCGYTKQYAGLQELYETYKDDGFVVLAFPCNDFRGQEPGSIESIVEFCTSQYDVTFPIFDKVRVLGDEAHPLYLDLRNQPEPVGGEPKWNFTKYLVDRRGQVVERFDSAVEPMGEKLQESVKNALAADLSEPRD